MSKIDIILRAADATVAKADQQAACGKTSIAQQFYRTAAKQYRQVAGMDPSKKDEYISVAEQLESKADQAGQQAVVKTSQNNVNGVNAVNNQPQVRNTATFNTAQTAPVATASQDNGQGAEVSLEQALEKLDALTGLGNLKKNIRSWISMAKFNNLRVENGLEALDGFSYHLVFTGNPGTGKTTVARIMADICKALGIIKTGQTIETSRSDLVAGYEGQTGTKTREVIQSALGGVLFIDEAYTLCGNGRDEGKDPFGQEAIDELLKAMEDYRENLVVIVAGYSNLMEKFLNANPGLKSRMNTVLEFEDYNGDEMFTIFSKMCAGKQLRLSQKAGEIAKAYFDKLYAERDVNFGNARTVRNVFQKAMGAMAERVIQSGGNVTIDDLTNLNEKDLINAMQGDNSGVCPEYELVKHEVTEAGIYANVSKGDMGIAAVSLCKRLEALLKYVYKFNGDLSEMINQLKEKAQSYSLNLSRQDFDRLYRIRTFRNAFVHSGDTSSNITEADVLECVKLFKKLENRG